MAQSKPIVNIENIVASAAMEQRLDLDDVTQKNPRHRIESRIIPESSFQIKNLKTATLFFHMEKYGVYG